MPTPEDDSKYHSTTVRNPRVRAEDQRVILTLELVSRGIRLDQAGIELVFEPKLAEDLSRELLLAVRKIEQ
jgi:hypothetical protein